MMEGYAQSAAELGKQEFGQKLDFTAESVDGLDEILVRVGESLELNLDFEVRLWGQLPGRGAAAALCRHLGDDPVSGRRGGGSGRGGARLAAVSTDEGLPPADCGRGGGSARLLCHGDGTAGQAGAGELKQGLGVND